MQQQMMVVQEGLKERINSFSWCKNLRAVTVNRIKVNDKKNFNY